MIKEDLFIVPRNARPAIIKSFEEFRKVEDVPVQADVIVITGKLNRVPTIYVGKFDKAVKERFLRNQGLRWNEKENRWVNGTTAPGKIVVEVWQKHTTVVHELRFFLIYRVNLLWYIDYAMAKKQ